jgi:hypothetical protein
MKRIMRKAIPDLKHPSARSIPRLVDAPWRLAGSTPLPGWWLDAALLFSALFLQRFTLTFGNSLMSLDVVPVFLLLGLEFARGRLLIQFRRLVLFIVAWLTVACSLVINFRSEMLPSFGLLTAIYPFFTLARRSDPSNYGRALLAFQFLAASLSALAISQFLAQLVIDGRELVQFFNVLPSFLFTERFNTIIPIAQGSGLIKSNGVFLTEPSTLSQIAAIAILIETTIFRRLPYILLFSLGLVLSFSGTGVVLLLVLLPFAVFRDGPTRRTVLVAIFFIVLLFVTGLIDPSIFVLRLTEFDDTQASAFERFISPFWLAGDYLPTASLTALLFGNGPGSVDSLVAQAWYTAFEGTWVKLIYEYGLVGTALFSIFLLSCFGNSSCPKILGGAMIFEYYLLGGHVLSTPLLTLLIVLCTSHLAAKSARGPALAVRSIPRAATAAA